MAHALSEVVDGFGEATPLRDFYIPHDPVYADPDGPGVSLTRQEFAEECDVNVLMRRYENTWPPKDPAVQEQFADVAWVPDLMTAQDQIDQANRMFMMLDARVRREFDNDPRQFVAFASDPANLEHLRDWGLAPREGPKVPVKGYAGGAGAPPPPPATPPADSAK